MPHIIANLRSFTWALFGRSWSWHESALKEGWLVLEAVAIEDLRVIFLKLHR
jgi:hypothetical protein